MSNKNTTKTPYKLDAQEYTVKQVLPSFMAKGHPLIKEYIPIIPYLNSSKIRLKNTGIFLNSLYIHNGIIQQSKAHNTIWNTWNIVDTSVNSVLQEDWGKGWNTISPYMHYLNLSLHEKVISSDPLNIYITYDDNKMGGMDWWVINLNTNKIQEDITVHTHIQISNGHHLYVQFIHNPYGKINYRESLDVSPSSMLFLHHDATLRNKAMFYMQLGNKDEYSLEEPSLESEKVYPFPKSGYVFESVDIHLQDDKTQALLESHYQQGESDYSLRVHMNHEGKYTQSHQIVKGVVDHQSIASYVGTITMQSSCIGGKAYQHHRGVILSPKAQILTKPELYIKQEEVQCSHGSSIGPLDENWVLYLSSRGLNSSMVTRLLLHSLLGWET